MGAASTAVSCVCASLSLPCSVRRPAVAMGRFLTLDLVVRCSSTSGAETSSGVLGPSVGLQFTGKPLSFLRFFEVMDSVFFLPLLVAPSLEAPQRGPARFCG